MKRILLLIAIVCINSILSSCTDLEENLENERIILESTTTGSEDGEDPEDQEQNPETSN